MSQEAVSSPPVTRTDRIPPYSEEAERGVLGAALLDSVNVMDLCVQSQLVPESFYLPAHRDIYDACVKMWTDGSVIDVLTLGEQLKQQGRLDRIGGGVFLDHLIDSTPTAAHAKYYVDIVRQKHLLRCIIDCARGAERECFGSGDSADEILSRAEQAFLDITERQHGDTVAWAAAVKGTVQHIEQMLNAKRGMAGVSTGFIDLDRKTQGLRTGEMIVLAARPSMGKTSLAMNIAEHVALGTGASREPSGVGIFSLEMSQESLVMRMLCSHAEVSAFKLLGGYVPAGQAHGKLVNAASVLTKAPIFLDDTGALDVLELRARARRMQRKHDIKLLVIDYLQLLHAREYARQGRQLETAHISGHLKAMAKELKLPVLVLSQLSRGPEQRDKEGRPRLSDLRDSGAIEQDADVVLMLRRPQKYDEEIKESDPYLAVIDVAKNRNGPTGEVELNFEEEYTLFRDRDRRRGVDDVSPAPPEEEQNDEP